MRYAVASSLDGFIAGPRDEADWIIMDPEIDFEALFSEFDTLLLGRRTFEGMAQAGQASMPGMEIVVFSRTLSPEDHPEVTIIGHDAENAVAALKAQAGKDIWLFGGGLLFSSLLELGVVDTVEIGLIPILLGEGIPLFPPPAPRRLLTLTNQRVYEKTGIVKLEYSVAGSAA